jgi:hypothetical protein
MGNAYDDAKYGVVQRKWFGIESRGGYRGYTFGTTDATSITHVKRWYPGRGPVKLLKAAVVRLATMTNASNDIIPVSFYTRGASASLACTLYAKNTSTAQAPWTVSSTTSLDYTTCKAGEYITIKSGTPRTDKGTAANTATTTGTVAFYVDYVPLYSTSWDL